MNWVSLREGSPRQRAAYVALVRLGIMEALAEYGPELCGTIPLGVDLPESDLDIICEAGDVDGFADRVVELYSGMEGFRLRRKAHQGLPSVIASFEYGGWAVQVFGQPRPVREQNAYRHMVAEARLLEHAGPEAAEAIRALKAGGMKTEPAFGAYFGLEGDPYEVLLELAGAPEEVLARVALGRG